MFSSDQYVNGKTVCQIRIQFYEKCWGSGSSYSTVGGSGPATPVETIFIFINLFIIGWDDRAICSKSWETYFACMASVFQHPESVDYAFKLLNGTELFNQNIRLQNKATGLGKYRRQ
jgi:hypothetical protein